MGECENATNMALRKSTLFSYSFKLDLYFYLFSHCMYMKKGKTQIFF